MNHSAAIYVHSELHKAFMCLVCFCEVLKISLFQLRKISLCQELTLSVYS